LSFPLAPAPQAGAGLVGPDASGLKKDSGQARMTENVTLLISFAIVSTLICK